MDREAIDEGRALVREGLRRRPPTRFALMAAIAAVHDEAPSWEETDWREIVGLDDGLPRYHPSPIAALDDLVLDPQLASYGFVGAARGYMLARLGRPDEARAAYEEVRLRSPKTKSNASSPPASEWIARSRAPALGTRDRGTAPQPFPTHPAARPNIAVQRY